MCARSAQGIILKRMIMKKSLLSFLATFVTLSINAMELAPCSFDVGNSAVLPECITQKIGEHSVEITRIPGHSGGLVLMIDNNQIKKFKIEGDVVNVQEPIPFLLNDRMIVLVDEASLSFYEIPSVFKTKSNSTINIQYADRISSFILIDENGRSLHFENANEFIKFFDKDERGISFGNYNGRSKVYINPLVDSQRVDSEYLKKALLDSAENKYQMIEVFFCKYQTKNDDAKLKCLQNAKNDYDTASLAIKNEEYQTYVKSDLEKTRLGKYYTPAKEGARYTLGAVVSQNGHGQITSVQSRMLIITNRGGGKTATLDLGNGNPYLMSAY